MRLLQNRRIAAMTSARLSNAATRNRYRLIGFASVAVSLVAAIVYYILWRQQVWLGLAAVIGLLSGAEMVGNVASPETSSLEWQNLLFGILYAIAAVATYLVLLK